MIQYKTYTRLLAYLNRHCGEGRNPVRLIKINYSNQHTSHAQNGHRYNSIKYYVPRIAIKRSLSSIYPIVNKIIKNW